MTQPTSPSRPGPDLAAQVARDLALPERGVAETLALLADKATVPFIARYRKERTGGLDEVQIRAIEERHGYLRELEDRRAAVLQSIAEQGKLDPELRRRLEACRTKAELEDLYLPFKPKRRTKATIARERGLGPLAERILQQPRTGSPEAEARRFVDAAREVPDVAAALDGAREIVAEVVSERADVRAMVREVFAKQSVVRSAVVKDKASERTPFEDYYDFAEPIGRLPAHRYLALARGEAQGVLKVKLEVEADRLLPRIERRVGLDERSPFAGELRAGVGEAFKRRLAPSVETEVRGDVEAWAHAEAVQVFAENLGNLLMAAPLGAEPVVGIDPGLRTGCKCAAVDATGRFVEHLTIYPFRGAGDEERARRELAALVRKHRPKAVAVGNGTGGRETEQLVRRVKQEAGLDDLLVVSVSEAGASVYSASDLARDEFPDLDLTVRGAISIARRLQDPLAELVKVEPKAIGVGQYQHDVSQTLLARKLGEVVESAVNRVGVELNTASAPLLSYVSGVGPSLAKKIVAHRQDKGAFASRAELKKVGGLGPKAFELAAGFLRVRDGRHPLDRSAVHPERYGVVERIAKDLRVPLERLVGDAELAARIEPGRYVTDEVGEPTLRDIVDELAKPGRDPRKRFEPPAFRDDVNDIADLREGMTLEGVVTNVTAFGAFVDVGVHQDGLVHISQLADRFVKNPHDVVKVGDRLTVRVLEVDRARKRIALTAKGAK